MRFVSLASGSSGNCIYIGTGKTNILIDCGISARKADTSLKSLGLEGGLEEIDAVLITHEHSDHIKGIKRLMSAYGKRVYTTTGTGNALVAAAKDEYFNYAGRELIEIIRADFEFEIGDISIIPFSTYHDAAEPCGFRFEINNSSVAVMTDCGHSDDYICDHLENLDAILLESNHDPHMLAAGPYPAMLKRRILSPRGHLSNQDAGELLSSIFTPRLKNVALGHLSKENNTPELAEKTVRSKLIQLRGADAGRMTYIRAASPSEITDICSV